MAIKNKQPSQKTIVYVTGDVERAQGAVGEFQDAGFEVTIVKDAYRAVNIADYKDKNWKPSIYVIEVVLPLMSGFELTRRVLEKYSDGKVLVILTAQHIAPVDTLEAQQAGAIALLPMPVTWPTVEDVVEKARARRAKLEKADFKPGY